MTAWDVVTWQEVADRLPADVVAAILAGPPPARRVRVGRALAAWWTRPRGTAAIYAAVGESYASTIRAMTGERPCG